MEAGALMLLGFILIFVLVSGLVILCVRGPADLEAWGAFVARVLRGDKRSIEGKESSDTKKHK
jgi:hypothetical protein